MSELREADMLWCVERLPEQVRNAIKAVPGAFLAGGYIRAIITHEDPNDYDLFVPTEQVAEALVEHLRATGLPAPVKTQHAYTFATKPAVQVVHRWTYTTTRECLANFDFSISRAAIWYDTRLGAWRSSCAEFYYEDLAAKRLVYTGMGEPGGSLLRLLKFTARGYRIPLGELALLVERVHKTAETRHACITDLLVEVDPPAASWRL